MEEFTAGRTGSPENLVMQLSGSMTIHNAVEIRDALLEAFKEATKLTCDLENVSDIDLAGLQLLCAAHRSSCVSGKQFEVVGLDREDISKVLECAGFARHIGCMQNENNRCIWVGGAE